MTISVEEPAFLSHTMQLYDNNTLRINPEDGDIRRVPHSFDFETDKNGFGVGNLVVSRPDNWDIFDSALLADLVTTDREGRNVYEAMVTATPQTGVNEITINLEGYSKHGDQDETAKMIFRDIDKNKWKGPSQAYKIADNNAAVDALDAGVSPDPNTGLPTIDCLGQSPTTRAAEAIALYDGKGVVLGSIYYNGALWNLSPGGATSAFVSLTDTADWPGGSDNTANLAAAASFSGTLNATKPTRKWAVLDAGNSGALSTTSGVLFGVKWTQAIPYGNHGLTKRGVEPNAGFYVSDMAAYIVQRWCPLWNVTADGIEQTSFIVPHAVYTEPQTTAGKMLDALVVFGGNTLYPLEWFIYDKRRFYMRSPGSYGNVYRVRLGEGSDSLDQGPDTSLMMNGVQAGYNPGDGSSKTVGPVGSGSDFETSAVQWADLNLPANRRGINVWKYMDCGIINQPGAILLAQLAMTARNNQQWRGSIVQRGPIRDSNGNVHPPYMIRTHESCVAEEDVDLRQRWITGTHYVESSGSVGQNQIDIGQRPDRIDQVLARAGVVITPLTGAS